MHNILNIEKSIVGKKINKKLHRSVRTAKEKQTRIYGEYLIDIGRSVCYVYYCLRNTLVWVFQLF